jgi:hypothetical protein
MWMMAVSEDEFSIKNSDPQQKIGATERVAPTSANKAVHLLQYIYFAATALSCLFDSPHTYAASK